MPKLIETKERKHWRLMCPLNLWMVEQNLRQVDVARTLGVNSGLVAAWREAFSLPNQEHMSALAALMDVSRNILEVNWKLWFHNKPKYRTLKGDDANPIELAVPPYMAWLNRNPLRRHLSKHNFSIAYAWASIRGDSQLGKLTETRLRNWLKGRGAMPALLDLSPIVRFMVTTKADPEDLPLDDEGDPSVSGFRALWSNWYKELSKNEFASTAEED